MNSNFKKNCKIELGKWNKIKLKISNKINDKNVIFYINNEEFITNLSNEINEISDLIFYSKFHGLISPIVISEINLENNSFFSKEYIYSLNYSYNENININELINNESNQNNTNIKESIHEIEKNNFVMNNHNKIPLLFFIKDISNKEENINEIIPLLQKKNFPNFYKYNCLNLKENIYLIGGTNNILPLYEIIKLFENEKYDTENLIKKITQLTNTIFSSETNINESIYSNSISILSQFLRIFYSSKNEKYILPLIEELIRKNIHNDNIFSSFKDLLLNRKLILKLSEKGKDAFITFISNLNKNKNIVFYYLMEFIKLENIDENFLKNIFNFFFDILNTDYTKIYDILSITENKKINIIIKGKILKILIQLIDIKIPEKMKKAFKKYQKNEIIKILHSKEKELENLKLSSSQQSSIDNNEMDGYSFVGLIEKTLKSQTDSERGIEKILEEKLKIISFMCENKLFSFIVEFSKFNNLSIKIDLLYFFQLIIFYYMQNYTLTLGNINNGNSENNLLELRSFQNVNKDVINSNNKDILLNKIILDFKKIIDISLNLKFNNEDILKNLNNSKIEILEYIYNFISLIRNNNFLVSHEEYFEKKIKIDFGNLYYSRLFIIIFIGLFHHIFQLKEREKENNLINEIQNQINNVIIDIYYDGIRVSPICFLEIVDQFDWYIFDNKEEISNNFRQYFFSILFKEIPSTYHTNSELDNFINIIQDLLFQGKNDYSLIELYDSLIKKDVCSKNLNIIIQSLKLQNLDYFIMNNFLIFYEVIVINANGFLYYIKDYLLFVIFCFLLYENNNIQSYSKSEKKNFIIGIVLISIKCLLLQIYSNEQINPQYYLLTSILMRMIYCSLYRNPENKLYSYFNEKYRNNSILTYFKIFNSKFDENNLEKTIKNSKDIIISMKQELLQLFRKTEMKRPRKYTYLSQILEQMSEKNNEIYKKKKKKEKKL